MEFLRNFLDHFSHRRRHCFYGKFLRLPGEKLLHSQSARIPMNFYCYLCITLELSARRDLTSFEVEDMKLADFIKDYLRRKFPSLSHLFTITQLQPTNSCQLLHLMHFTITAAMIFTTPEITLHFIAV